MNLKVFLTLIVLNCKYDIMSAENIFLSPKYENMSVFEFHANGVTRTEAYNTCLKRNGTLAVIDNEKTLQNLQNLVRGIDYFKDRTFWIGLKKRKVWEWATDGSAMTYTAWVQGSPSDNTINKNHAVLWYGQGADNNAVENYKWKDFSGNSKVINRIKTKYICMSNSNCLVLSHCVLNRQLCKEIQNHCYFFGGNELSKRSEGVTWSEALNKCKEIEDCGIKLPCQGGKDYPWTLASVNNEIIQNSLGEYLKENKLYKGNYWINAERSDNTDWIWDTGKQLAWANWYSGKPSINNEELCVMMKPNRDQNNYRYRLQSFRCNEQIYFVCQYVSASIWSSWSAWSDCSQTCGKGVRYRNRTCQESIHNPRTDLCEGEKTQTDTNNCDLNSCSVNGVWSNWGAWSKCSATCGNAIKTRKRRCNNPMPQNGGEECHGKNQTSEDCTYKDCPVNGGWTTWTSWTECTVNCGNCTRTRTRKCEHPKPKYGGLSCDGNNEQTETYNVSKCPNADLLHTKDIFSKDPAQSLASSLSKSIDSLEVVVSTIKDRTIESKTILSTYFYVYNEHQSTISIFYETSHEHLSTVNQNTQKTTGFRSDISHEYQFATRTVPIFIETIVPQQPISMKLHRDNTGVLFSSSQSDVKTSNYNDKYSLEHNGRQSTFGVTLGPDHRSIISCSVTKNIGNSIRILDSDTILQSFSTTTKEHLPFSVSTIGIEPNSRHSFNEQHIDGISIQTFLTSDVIPNSGFPLSGSLGSLHNNVAINAKLTSDSRHSLTDSLVYFTSKTSEMYLTQKEHPLQKASESKIITDANVLQTNSGTRKESNVFSTIHLSTYISNTQISMSTYTENTYMPSVLLPSSSSPLNNKYASTDMYITTEVGHIRSRDMLPSISISLSGSLQTKRSSYDGHTELFSIFLTKTKDLHYNDSTNTIPYISDGLEPSFTYSATITSGNLNIYAGDTLQSDTSHSDLFPYDIMMTGPTNSIQSSQFLTMNSTGVQRQPSALSLQTPFSTTSFIPPNRDTERFSWDNSSIMDSTVLLSRMHTKGLFAKYETSIQPGNISESYQRDAYSTYNITMTEYSRSVATEPYLQSVNVHKQNIPSPVVTPNSENMLPSFTDPGNDWTSFHTDDSTSTSKKIKYHTNFSSYIIDTMSTLLHSISKAETLEILSTRDSNYQFTNRQISETKVPQTSSYASISNYGWGTDATTMDKEVSVSPPRTIHDYSTSDVFYLSSLPSQGMKPLVSIATDSSPLSPTPTQPLSYLLLPSENRESSLHIVIATALRTDILSMTQEGITTGSAYTATKTLPSLSGLISNNIHMPPDPTAQGQGTSIRKDTYVYNISPTQTMQENTILDNSVYSSKMETSRSTAKPTASTTPNTETSKGSTATTHKNDKKSEVPLYKWLLIGSFGLLVPLCCIIGILIYCCARYNRSQGTDKDSDIKKPHHMSETWYDNVLFKGETGQMPKYYIQQYRKGITNTQITKSVVQTYDQPLDVANNDSNTKSGSHRSTETVDLQRSSATKVWKQDNMHIPNNSNYRIKKNSSGNRATKSVYSKRNSEVLNQTNTVTPKGVRFTSDHPQQPHLMVPRQYKYTRAQKVETYLYEEESGVLVPYGYMESSVPIPDYEDTSVVPLPDY